MASISAAAAFLAVLQFSTMASADSHVHAHRHVRRAATLTTIGCYSSGAGSIMVNKGDDRYQSSGNCGDVCFASGYGVAAINNRFDCLCSQMLPSPDYEVSTSQCAMPCPGYPSETCGGPNTYQLYLTGKVAHPPVAKANGGSQKHGHNGSGASSVPVSSSPPSSSVPVPTHHHHQQQQQQHHHHHHHHHQQPTSSVVHHKPKPKTSSTSTSVKVKTTVKTTQTVVTKTTGGKTITQTTQATVKTTFSGSANESRLPSSSSGGGVNIGAIVGGIVVGIAGIIAIIVAIIFILKYRRAKINAVNGHKRADSLNAFIAEGGNQPPPPPLAGKHFSLAFGDSRLDSKMMSENKRESVGSVFADSQDYSRKILKVTNPDR